VSAAGETARLPSPFIYLAERRKGGATKTRQKPLVTVPIQWITHVGTYSSAGPPPGAGGLGMSVQFWSRCIT
jgi:hypothetical protein